MPEASRASQLELIQKDNPNDITTKISVHSDNSTKRHNDKSIGAQRQFKAISRFQILGTLSSQ